MPTITIFQNGQVQTSSALTDSQMNTIFQLLITQILGVVADLQLLCNVLIDNAIISTPLIVSNIAPGFIASGNNIPFGTTILSLAGEGTNLLITLSNEATGTATEQVSFYDPNANTRVRNSWPQKGSPGFAITDDTLFIRCVLDPTTYNVRDQYTKIDPNNDKQILKNRSYTRQWRVAFVAYGPNACDSLRLISSMLLEDFPHDTLAASKLYLMPDLGTPVRNPELYEGQWWERWDFAADFNEEVCESITVIRVASIPVIGSTSDNRNFSETIQGV
jgi:hypothetical protein